MLLTLLAQKRDESVQLKKTIEFLNDVEYFELNDPFHWHSEFVFNVEAHLALLFIHNFEPIGSAGFKKFVRNTI